MFRYNRGGQHGHVREPHEQIQLCNEPKYLQIYFM